MTASDLAGITSWRSDGAGCPAAGGDRKEQVRCAVFVLGSLIGTTMTHEIGHSLGLASGDPKAPHNSGRFPNQLMAGGGNRTVRERAELGGEGPGVFCAEDFMYLRRILPTEDPAPEVTRPRCF